MAQTIDNCLERDDNELINACRTGDERSSYCLVKRYYTLFKTRLMALGARLPDVEDAFQDAMIALHLHLIKNPTFQLKGPLEAYFWTITHRAYLKYVKKYDRERI